MCERGVSAGRFDAFDERNGIEAHVGRDEEVADQNDLDNHAENAQRR